MKKFDLKKWIVENKHGKTPSFSNYAGSFGKLNEDSPLAWPAEGPYCCDKEYSNFGFNGNGDDWSEETTDFIQNMETLNLLTGNEMIGTIYALYCDSSICENTATDVGQTADFDKDTTPKGDKPTKPASKGGDVSGRIDDPKKPTKKTN